MKLSQSSLNNLKGVHPDLQKVVKRAIEITSIDFKVTEGLRSVEQQKKNVAKGVSTTMNSRHLTGHAVDLVPLKDVNNDGTVDAKEMYSWPVYYDLAKIIKQAAKDVGVTVEWGGDWKSFKDGPHWQLPFNKYPKTQKFGLLVDNAEQMSSETDAQAHTKAGAAIAAGATGATSVGSDAAVQAFQTLVLQQGEITSGDWVRIGVATAIILGTAIFAWKKLK